MEEDLISPQGVRSEIEISAAKHRSVSFYLLVLERDRTMFRSRNFNFGPCAFLFFLIFFSKLFAKRNLSLFNFLKKKKKKKKSEDHEKLKQFLFPDTRSKRLPAGPGYQIRRDQPESDRGPPQAVFS